MNAVHYSYYLLFPDLKKLRSREIVLLSKVIQTGRPSKDWKPELWSLPLCPDILKEEWQPGAAATHHPDSS